MNDILDKNHIQELEKLKALYKASHRGVAPKLSQSEMKLLLYLGKTENNEKKDKNLKAPAMVRMLKMQVESQLKAAVGVQKWEITDSTTKDQLIWLTFVREYGMSPEYIGQFINKITNK